MLDKANEASAKKNNTKKVDFNGLKSTTLTAAAAEALETNINILHTHTNTDTHQHTHTYTRTRRPMFEFVHLALNTFHIYFSFLETTTAATTECVLSIETDGHDTVLWHKFSWLSVSGVAFCARR